MSGRSLTGGNRRFPRYRIDICARVALGLDEQPAHLVDVSEGGGFVAIREGEEIPPIGSGLRIDFRLPIGFWVRANCIVRWVRDKADILGVAGCGVEFTSMHSSNHELLCSYLRGRGEEDELLALDTRLTDKFRAVVDAGVIAMSISGTLDLQEATALRDSVLAQLPAGHRQSIRLFLNACHFRTSPPPALEVFGEVLEDLGKRGLELGVIVEPPALAGSQIRRVVRNAGIADALVSFVDEVEASSFWADIMAREPSTDLGDLAVGGSVR